MHVLSSELERSACVEELIIVCKLATRSSSRSSETLASEEYLKNTGALLSSGDDIVSCTARLESNNLVRCHGNCGDHNNDSHVVHLYSAICIASEALLTIYIALLPKGACGSADWVSNMTHYDCCHYRRMQERNPFGQSARHDPQKLQIRSPLENK